MSSEESTDVTARPDFANLQIETLRRAATIYLEVAYGTAPIPPAVSKRLDWKEGVETTTLLNALPFEKVGNSGVGGSSVFALRLGNTRYPHMKLQVQPWTGSSGFLLSVNTHDQVLALNPNSPDAEAFRSLQSENQKLKQGIEQAWDKEGLPTFLRYLRDYLKTQTTGNG